MCLGGRVLCPQPIQQKGRTLDLTGQEPDGLLDGVRRDWFPERDRFGATWLLQSNVLK